MRNARLNRWAVLFVCAVVSACAHTPEHIPPQRPARWTDGYTMLEDPAAVTSQVSNCLHTWMDPRRMDDLRGVVRFKVTTDVLDGSPAVSGFFQNSRRRIVYRQETSAGVDEEVVMHEVMHWIYETGRMPEQSWFAGDLARFLEEFKNHQAVKSLAKVWELSVRHGGESYRTRYHNEHYAYIGGRLLARNFQEDGSGIPPVMPDYLWRHFQDVLSPSLRRWRPTGPEEVDLAFGSVEIGAISSGLPQRLTVTPDQFEAMRRYGAVVALPPSPSLAARIERLAPSTAAISSMAVGTAVVPAGILPVSLELRLKLPKETERAWMALPVSQRLIRLVRVIDAEGRLAFQFDGEDVARIDTDARTAFRWFVVRVDGKCYEQVRRLLAAFYNGPLTVDWIVAP